MTNFKLTQLIFECDQCGACCRHLILEADHCDAIREPRIQTEGRLLDGHGKIEFEEAAWSLMNKGAPHDCVFVNEDNTCGVYQTRPDMCVSLQAGSEQCQLARTMAKLESLKPASCRCCETYAEKLHVLAREGCDK